MSINKMDLSPRLPYSSNYQICNGVEIHYKDWGCKSAPVVLMAHGLGRTGNDFDELAYALSRNYRVICPDMLGRGLSQWATDSKQYSLDNYVKILGGLLDRLQIESCSWVGTSMGGATGMLAAAGILKDRISHLVINDIGPELPQTAIERILNYVGNPPVFDYVHELELWLRNSYAPYGWLSDKQWQRMATTSARRLDSGKVTAHYDPNIAQQFVHYPDDYNRWHEFTSLEIPVALMRGKQSDLLTPEITEKMQATLSHLVVQEFDDCGHAPALNVVEQIDFVLQNIYQGDKK